MRREKELTDWTRRTACLRCDPGDTIADSRAMRDDIVMGPTAVAADIAVPGETDPAANHGDAVLARDDLRVDDQLSAVQQGSARVSREQWHQPDASPAERTASHQVTARVHDQRAD